MSKFGDIIKANRNAPVPTPTTPEPAGPLPSPATVEALPSPRRGRPPGKRSSADHDQVTAYIRRQTHHKVKLALLQDGEVQDFSELVEALLCRWLDSRT